MEQDQNINQEEDRLFAARKNNLEKIVEMGVNPYPKSFDRTHLSKDIINDLDNHVVRRFRFGSHEERQCDTR